MLVFLPNHSGLVSYQTIKLRSLRLKGSLVYDHNCDESRRLPCPQLASPTVQTAPHHRQGFLSMPCTVQMQSGVYQSSRTMNESWNPRLKKPYFQGNFSSLTFKAFHLLSGLFARVFLVSAVIKSFSFSQTCHGSKIEKTHYKDCTTKRELSDFKRTFNISPKP